MALQSGKTAANNILADFEGESRAPFAYRDKGIMAMIGRGAAIAEVGKHHHEFHGQLAHLAWLGVHATLMTGARAKHRRVHRLGLGPLQQDRRPARPRSRRRRPDRLGGRPRGSVIGSHRGTTG